MTRASIAALFLLTACHVAGDTDRAQAPPPQEPSLVGGGKAISTLSGEWRVAGIDGRSFNEPYGLALSGDAATLWWAPRCAGFTRSYRLSGTRVQFETVALPQASDGRPSPVCLIAIPARLDEVFAGLDSADQAVRTSANGIEISGGGHDSLLFSQ